MKSALISPREARKVISRMAPVDPGQCGTEGLTYWHESVNVRAYRGGREAGVL